MNLRVTFDTYANQIAYVVSSSFAYRINMMDMERMSKILVSTIPTSVIISF